MKRLKKLLLVILLALVVICPLSVYAIESPATKSIWVEGVYANTEVVEKNGVKGYNLTNTKKDWTLNLTTTKKDYTNLQTIFELKSESYKLSIKNTEDGTEYTTTNPSLKLKIGTNKFDVVISDTDGTTEEHTLTINLTYKEATSDSGNPESGSFLNIGLIGGTVICFGVIYAYQKRKSKFYKI